MPRGYKCRRVCMAPDNTMFTPENPCGDTVNLALEELEAVRLCDLEGMEQDAAAEQMNISRGTLQRILYDARRKIAEALCTGKTIVIGGGNYELSGQACPCKSRCKNCMMDRHHYHHEKGDSTL